MHYVVIAGKIEKSLCSIVWTRTFVGKDSDKENTFIKDLYNEYKSFLYIQITYNSTYRMNEKCN